MKCKGKYTLTILIFITFVLLIVDNTYAVYKNVEKEIYITKDDSIITKNDSSFVLEIIPNENFVDGEYMKIALHYGPGDEKIIFEGKLKRDKNDYHYIVRFKTQLEKYVYNILTVTTGKKKKTTAYIGIKVNHGNYRNLWIWKYPTKKDILLMLSDEPVTFN